MEQPKAYGLNVNTIKTLSDVKVILDGLNLITYSNMKDFDKLKKYFTEEIVESSDTDTIS
jgi:hypothetical protein